MLVVLSYLFGWLMFILSLILIPWENVFREDPFALVILMIFTLGVMITWTVVDFACLRDKVSIHLKRIVSIK